MVEVFSMNDTKAADKPCSRAVFDIQLTSIDYLGPDTLIASDV